MSKDGHTSWGKILYILYFPEAQVVIAEDEQGLSYMIRKLNDEYEHAGLISMNLDKRNYLAVINV